MKAWNCADVSDLLPDRMGGRLTAVEAALVDGHLAGCAACAGEAALLRALGAARPEPPADLAARIGVAARAVRPRIGSDAPPARAWPVRRWAIPATAAAAVVLTLGTFALRGGGSPVSAPLGEVVLEDPVWIAEDAIVAGAPVLDELQDEELALLLEELGG